MEKEINVVPYAVIRICDSCNQGEMLPTGEVKYPGPLWCEHRCERCGNTNNFNEKYPLIKFRREV